MDHRVQSCQDSARLVTGSSSKRPRHTACNVWLPTVHKLGLYCWKSVDSRQHRPELLKWDSDFWNANWKGSGHALWKHLPGTAEKNHENSLLQQPPFGPQFGTGMSETRSGFLIIFKALWTKHFCPISKIWSQCLDQNGLHMFQLWLSRRTAPEVSRSTLHTGQWEMLR
jgi:hypothetical protein